MRKPHSLRTLKKILLFELLTLCLFLNMQCTTVSAYIHDEKKGVNVYFNEDEWEPQLNDTFTVDVSRNMGYLTHTDGSYLEFEVATGAKRYVYYIGRSYQAGTPYFSWEAKSMDIKGDRVTFGSTGRFIRLYHEGNSTPYGIHAYRYEDQAFKGTRYFSMGCIIVHESTLNLIEQTYHLNGDYLKVETLEHYNP